MRKCASACRWLAVISLTTLLGCDGGPGVAPQPDTGTTRDAGAELSDVGGGDGGGVRLDAGLDGGTPTDGGAPLDAHESDAGLDGGIDAFVPHTLIAITVVPGDTLVELDLNATGSQTFVAMGVFADGVDEDVSAMVTWGLSNPAVGAMTGATLDIPAFPTATVELSSVTASLGSVVGRGQITIAAYRRSGPTQDFFFVLPHADPAGALTRSLDFATQIPALDVFFLVDTTASMFGAITNLESSISSIIVPGVQAEVANSRFGVGAFEDFPVSTYGSLHGSDCGRGGLSTPDQPFHLFRAITGSVSEVQAGTSMLRTATGPIGCGQDWPEAGIEALYQVSTGDGLTGPAPTSVPSSHAGVGGVAFRADSMPVIVQVTDALFHGPGETGSCPTSGDSANYAGAVAAVAHSRASALTALASICARVVGVVPIQPTLAPACSAAADLRAFATATGARVPPAAWDVAARPAGCAAGQCCTAQNGAGRAPDAEGLCPIVFEMASNGSGLGTNVVTGLRMLTRFATFDVTSVVEGETTDVDGNPLASPHTTADFVRTVTPTSFVLPPAPPVVAGPTMDALAFHGVTPGTTVSFDVAAFNDFVMPSAQPQVFRARIRVLAGGCTPLDVRDVLVLVPATPPS